MNKPYWYGEIDCINAMPIGAEGRIHLQGRVWAINGEVANHKVITPIRGSIYTQLCFYKNGRLHNENGPAVFAWEDQCCTIRFFLNGLIHNENGPAAIRVYKTGKIYRNFYYHGEYVGREDGKEKFESTFGCNLQSAVSALKLIQILET